MLAHRAKGGNVVQHGMAERVGYNLIGLDLGCTLKELHRLLIDLILDEVGPKPRDDVHVDREIAGGRGVGRSSSPELRFDK